ncbi:MAG: hypothetical protein E5Y12_00770 [Mesorhizobium sp.]|nr:MAG: hypothetical protein E5Y12_00770 [Mesorhizobium sp.]
MKRTDGSSSNDDAPPGAPASLPYDRTTVERFQKSFPRARWSHRMRWRARPSQRSWIPVR